MLRYALRRVLLAVPMIILVSIVAFSFEYLLPGNPALIVAGSGATTRQVQIVSRKLGLDHPLVVQYVDWVKHAMTGNLGTSFLSGTSVAHGFGQALPVTLSLVVVASAFALPLAAVLGVASGRRPGSAVDQASALVASLSIAAPGFWVGLILVSLFSVRFHVLPANGYVSLTTSPWHWLQHLILPGVVLGFQLAGVLTLQLRGSIESTLESRFVRTMRAYGLSERRVIWKHALREAAPPSIHVSAVQLAYILGGTAIVEQIFNLPGLGQYVLNAITGHDIPVIQAAVLLFSTIVVLVNLGADLVHAAVIPRLRSAAVD